MMDQLSQVIEVERADIQALIQQITDKAARFDSCFFSFVTKQANQVADCVAKVSRIGKCCMYFLQERFKFS